MAGIELKGGIEAAKEVSSWLPRILRWARNRIVYRAAGLPRRAVTITPHQEFRPFWCLDPHESERTMYARCDWNIHNITSDPVSIVGTHLGRRERYHSEVRMFVLKNDLLSPQTIAPKKTAEAACYFWITPPPLKTGQDLRTDVELVDQYGNRYKEQVTFVYDASVERIEKRGSVGLPAPRMDKLRIHILEGIADTDSSTRLRAESYVFLRVRVVNMKEPAVTIKRWHLQLKKADGTPWHTGYPCTLPYSCFRRISCSGKSENLQALESMEKELDKFVGTRPLDPNVAEEGWLKFRVEHEIVHHVFGMTFLLTAYDNLDNETKCEMAPGEWLNPVRFGLS